LKARRSTDDKKSESSCLDAMPVGIVADPSRLRGGFGAIPIAGLTQSRRPVIFTGYPYPAMPRAPHKGKVGASDQSSQGPAPRPVLLARPDAIRREVWGSGAGGRDFLLLIRN
jgi:hypothetical protein